jgi:dihydropteroate synthase
MGVLNLTPDSFSDGGRFGGVDDAVAAACRMAEEGADFIDVGGESTRPRAAEVDPAEEARRVLPVIAALAKRCAARISIDTRKAEVARLALAEGAALVNDVSALADGAMAAVLARARAPVILMHMRGTPATMQDDTAYGDVVAEVSEFLRERVAHARNEGIADARILVDPGIGFGKSPEGSLRILRDLPALRSAGRPIVIGASRKSFVGAVLDLPVGERLEGSLAAAAIAAWQGAHVIRAHDVAATVRVVRMVDAIRNA